MEFVVAEAREQMGHDLIAVRGEFVEQRPTEIADDADGSRTDLILSVIVQGFVDERKDVIDVLEEVHAED